MIVVKVNPEIIDRIFDKLKKQESVRWKNGRKIKGCSPVYYEYRYICLEDRKFFKPVITMTSNISYYKEIRMVTPSEFLELVEKQGDKK